MREELACAINGEDFHSIAPCLYIQDFEEQVKQNIETSSRPHYGQMLIGANGHDELSVVIRFMVKERDRAKRQLVIDRVNAWAKAGWLTLSTRRDKRLYVMCTQPAGSAALRWSNDLQLTLTAFYEAYWQDLYPVEVSLSGSSGRAVIRPMGTRNSFLEFDIANQSGNVINSFSISANGRDMAFSGLGLQNGKTMSVYYDALHLLHAETDSAQKLNCRTGDSADDILLSPVQDNTVYFTADGACAVTLKARGLWE